MGELSPYFIRRTGVPPAAQPVLLNEPVSEDSPEIVFWDFWRVIRKHKWLIVLSLFTVVVTVGVGTLLMPRIYTSQATLLIEEKGPQVVDFKQVLSESIVGKKDYYETQYEILKSHSLAAQVIREQNLGSNKIFTGEEKTAIAAALWSSLKSWIKDQSWVAIFRSSAKTIPEDPTKTLTQLTDNYLSKNYLEIKPVKNTRLVGIAFSTPDPGLSAQLANAHAQAYIRQGLKLRALANADAEQFLEKKLVELKDRVEKSEVVLSNYRADKGIISLNDKENVVVERLADLNKRLTEAEAERITLQAQVQLIRQRAFDSLPDVITNKLIQTLKEQLSRVEGEYANLSAEYNLGYPRLAQLKSQVDDTRRRLNEEIRTVVAGIESAFLVVGAKEKALRGKFAEQRSAALQLKDAAVEYAILAREVDTNNQLYNSIFQRMKEMEVAGEITGSNVSVIDEAKPPLKPSAPNTVFNLLVGILMGATGGVALAFFVEYLDKTVSRSADVERYVHLPTLGIVPEFSARGIESEGSFRDSTNGNGSLHGASPHSKSLTASLSPLSLVAESYRSLQTAIFLSQVEEPPRTVLFTSGCREEGKTTTTINTAIVFAQMEAKVLVIDADLRKPSCHKHLFRERAVGLTELLTGQRTLEEVTKATLTDNLFLMTAGAIPPDPVKLVGSRKMHEVLTRLREQFDYIFIDSPPLIAVSDAVRLSTMVDGVVLVVNGQETTRDDLKGACSRLRYARANILGVVLNRVDMKSGDYPYYNRDFYRTTASPEETGEHASV